MGDRFIDRTHELAEEVRRVADPVAVDAGLMARLRSRIAGIETPAMRGDCLAIMLVSDFEAWADKDEETDESGTWKLSAIKATDEVLDAIVAVCTDALHAAEERAAERMRERAECAAHEQRCERGTPWDLACVTIATAIRSLSTED